MRNLNRHLLSEEKTKSESHIKRIVDILRYSDVYSAQLQKDLNQVIDYSKNQIVDFNLLERGIMKVLKMKGDKSKNILEFFKKNCDYCF